jgi:hypothetical protein
MQCVSEVGNAMEEVLRVMCRGGSVNDAVAMAALKVKDDACAKEVDDALRGITLGEAVKSNNPVVNNYLLYVKSRVSEALKRSLASILLVINGGDVDQALNELVTGICTSSIDDLPYIVDLARLITLAKYDKSVIDDVACRVRLLINRT